MRNLLVVVLVAGLATSASAYRLDEDGSGHVLYWATADRPVRYWVASASVPDGRSGEEAVRRAAASWSGITDGFGLRFAGRVAEVGPRNDGRNEIGWIWRDWPFDPTLLATTVRHHGGDGRILDADVLFNAEEHAWSTDGGGFDVESAAAHELGHLAGLGHSEAGSATMYALMPRGETRKRSLEDDDRAGLVALYGRAAAAVDGSAQGISAAPAGGSGGGCAVSPDGEGRRGHPWPFVVALLVLAGMKGRKRTARAGLVPDGGRTVVNAASGPRRERCSSGTGSSRCRS